MDTIENPIVPPPLVTEPEVTPPLPIGKPKGSSPLIPILFGVVFVVIISAVLAGFYYFARLKKEVSDATPSPSPSIITTPSLEPSSTATSSSSPSGSAKPSVKASSNPTATPRPTITPTPAPSSTPNPTPTTTTSTLDIRFGNPSAHVKQTFDDGSGDGRVINREYSSIQVGEFDEIKSTWSPKVTVCFHMVSNQDINGNQIGYNFTVNDKVTNEKTLSQYDKIEAGKTYDICHDVSTEIGSYKVQLNINNTRTLSESTYANNNARIDFKNSADNVPPNFTLAGPFNENDKGTCLRIAYLQDNVTLDTKLKVEHKIDTADWATYAGTEYCFKGNSGSSHTYGVKVTDERGNKTEQTSTFNLF